MFKDLLTYEAIFDSSEDFIDYATVTFLRDFGQWKKGDVVDGVKFDLYEGYAVAIDEDGNETGEKQPFQLTAVTV